MFHPRSCRTGLAALLALTLSACASVDQPANQEVALRTTEGGERVQARCEIGNAQASWSVVAPATFGVARSASPLNVDCRTAEGGQGTRAFDAARQVDLRGGGSAGFGYPPVLEVAVVREVAFVREAGIRPAQDAPSSFADLGDVGRLPRVGEDGRDGYRRFLTGESPRAFAISGDGHWVRVNAARDAPRLALERCETYGRRCRLYAVDHRVVWESKGAGTS